MDEYTQFKVLPVFQLGMFLEGMNIVGLFGVNCSTEQ